MERTPEKQISASFWKQSVTPQGYGWALLAITCFIPLMLLFGFDTTASRFDIIQYAFLFGPYFFYGLLLITNVSLAERWFGLPGKLNKRGNWIARTCAIGYVGMGLFHFLHKK